jgi:hypothetical protein
VFTTAAHVRPVNARKKDQSLELLLGKPQGTRKKPHVINVALRQNAMVNYVFITLMEI